MKKTLLFLFIFLATLNARAQEARRVFTTTSVATDVGVLETGTGVQYHQLTWYVTGSVPTCQVLLESSPDNITFSTVIAAQTCTSSGASAISALTVANYFRIRVSTKSGAGSVTATYLGFVADPSSSGGGTVVSITGAPPIIVTPDPITGTGVISCPTCGAGSGSINGTTANNQISFGTSSPSTISNSANLTFTQGGGQSTVTLGVNSSFVYTTASNTLTLSTTSGDGEIDLNEGANVLFRGNVTSGVQTIDLMGGQTALGGISFHAGNACWGGTTSGLACFGVAAAAGTPNTFLLPLTTGGNGQLLGTDGGNPQQLSWVDKAGGTNFGTPPTSPNGATYFGCDIVSGGVAGLSFCLPGVSGRSVAGASDTILAADRAEFVSYTNAGAVAVTVPQAGTTNFNSNFPFGVKAKSGTTVTLTPTTSQIAGNDGVLSSSLVISPSTTAWCYSFDNANYQCSLTGAGSGATPTLNQVLDPTVDKTFAMGNHLLKFNNGAVLAGVDDAAMPGITGYTLGTQASFSVGVISLTPFVSLAELNNSAPTLTAGSSFAGANISAFETRTSGVKIGALSALQLDATITSNLGADGLEGIGLFIWDQGSGNITNNIFGIDSGVEKDGGTVSQNIAAFHAQSASNGATVTGFVAGMHIEDQSTGSGTSAATYGLKIDNQTLHSPFAIKTGLGKVEFGDTTVAPTPSTGDSSTKVATTAFVATAISNAIAGVNPAVAVRVATAAILPNSPTYNNGVAGIGATLTTATTNTTLVVDGVTLVLNDRVLVKNQASAFQNGVYFVSQVQSLGLAWILTRALDYDMPSDINNTGAIPVVSGTVNTTTQWVITSTVTTVGTDALTYTQFTANPANNVLAVSPGAGIAHFAGSTQTVTSSAVVSADLSITTTTCTNQVVSAISATAVGTCHTIAGADMTSGTVTATQLATQYSQWLACDGKGIGDGLNAMTAGTYLMSTCRNTTGVTVTITGIKCFTDNSGSSTLNVAGNTLGALLTGAVTCTSSYASGTQSANILLTANDYIKFTFVADGTSKQTDWVVTGTF